MPLSAVAMTAKASKHADEAKLGVVKKPGLIPKSESKSLDQARKPSEIKFVRNRMFYARPALNGSGGVRLGLRHIRKTAPSGFVRS
jgi:hypothetical protein